MYGHCAAMHFLCALFFLCNSHGEPGSVRPTTMRSIPCPAWHTAPFCGKPGGPPGSYLKKAWTGKSGLARHRSQRCSQTHITCSIRKAGAGYHTGTLLQVKQAGIAQWAVWCLAPFVWTLSSSRFGGTGRYRGPLPNLYSILHLPSTCCRRCVFLWLQLHADLMPPHPCPLGVLPAHCIRCAIPVSRVLWDAGQHSPRTWNGVRG